MSSNPLVTGNKTSEQSVQLHPLVLLTISDYIARHTLRQHKGPIVGAIIGTQHGRDITMEHAFEAKTVSNEADGTVLIDDSWFHERLQQYKDVHKSPALDLVGWFTLAPSAGPQPHHLPVHRQLAAAYNESILLLAFHASPLLEHSAKDDKLPLTIYEPVVEAGLEDGDKLMQSSGEQHSTVLKFKELPYTIETGDAEMIGVDFVAAGSANATGIPPAVVPASPSMSNSKGKGKAKAKAKEGRKEDDAQVNYLSAEEEDLIASMTAKANAIRMLKQRVSLIRKYLASLPPCYLNDPAIETCEAHPQVSHTILRSISSLLARLPLLVPYTPLPPQSAVDGTAAPLTSEYERESASQASDVALISLLGTLGSTLQSAQSMSTKAGLVDHASQASLREKSRMAFLDYEQYGHDPSVPDGLEANA